LLVCLCHALLIYNADPYECIASTWYAWYGRYRDEYLDVILLRYAYYFIRDTKCHPQDSCIVT